MKNIIATLILIALIPTISSAQAEENLDNCNSENNCVVIQRTILDLERFVSRHAEGNICQDEALLLVKGAGTILSGRMGYEGPGSAKEKKYRAVSQYLKPYFAEARQKIQSNLDNPSLKCNGSN